MNFMALIVAVGMVIWIFMVSLKIDSLQSRINRLEQQIAFLEEITSHGSMDRN